MNCHSIDCNKQLREELDCGALKSFDADTSPHDVASLLKEYLRDLPEPLLCRSLYPAFLSTQSMQQAFRHNNFKKYCDWQFSDIFCCYVEIEIRNRRLQLEALSHLIQLLPIAHRDTLFVLLKFLAHVARCSDDVMNLASNTIITGFTHLPIIFLIFLSFEWIWIRHETFSCCFIL